MKKLLQKFNDFVKTSVLSFGGLLLILQSIILPANLYKYTGVALNGVEPAEAAEQAAEQTVATKKIIPAAAKQVMYVTVTAYSSTPDQTDDTPFITANGTHVRDGIIAANFLPFGAKVRFPDYSGNKIYEVTDRMHPRFSDRADIWFPTREQALAFGLRRLKMEVL